MSTSAADSSSSAMASPASATLLRTVLESSDDPRATVERQLQLLTGVLDSSLDGIAAFEAVRDSEGQIVDFTWLVLNSKAESMLGRSSSELVGKGLLDTLPGNRDLGLFDSYVRVVETGEPARHEFRYQADAISGWFQNIAAPFGDGFTVTFRDITRQKEAEETRLALAAARMGIWEIDPVTGVITGSLGTFELFGLTTADEPTLAAFIERIHEADRQAVQLALDEAIAGGRPLMVEFRVIQTDGAARWLISRGAVVTLDGGRTRLTGVLTDVTEAKLAEDRALRLLAATSALAGALTPWDVVEVLLEQGMTPLGAASAAVWMPTPDGSLAPVGIRGYQLLPDDEHDLWTLTGKSPLEDTIGDGNARFLSGAELAAAYPELGPRLALYGRSCACLPLNVGERALGALVLSFGGERGFSAAERAFLASLVGICAQALDRAALFEQERSSRALAEEALGLRDQFLNAAAHELRTPLTVLLGNAGLLARRAARGQDERSLTAARSVTAQVMRLDRLINLLVEISTMQGERMQLDPAPLDLGELVARVVTNVQPSLYGHPLAVTTAQHVIVEGDASWLERVFQELIDNAVRYSPTGEPITVRVEVIGTTATVTVADRGVGIPLTALPLVFNRFYRAPNVDPKGVSGLGLGLTMARTVIDAHGGTIELSSLEGKGSTVTVRLPLTVQPDDSDG